MTEPQQKYCISKYVRIIHQVEFDAQFSELQIKNYNNRNSYLFVGITENEFNEENGKSVYSLKNQ